ncbi:MAG TPA: M50 family metallopeptidase [Kofleriaceae bacterium]|nr:M50 family metallopeptidase [Kofleriaceae bacterium]
MTLALSILALGFLIIVHEAGHYFVARWCGMRVERFSIGFGPGLLKHRSKRSGTVFQIAPIPFGGFVEIRGMNIAEEVEPDDAQAYPNRPAWQRFVTIFAGPATNYLAAVVLALLLYNCHGVDKPTPRIHVAQVLADSDAVGKLKENDYILKVDDQPLIADQEPSLVTRVADKKGKPLKLTIRRDGKELEVTITPRPSKDEKGNQVYRLGVAYSPVEPTDVGVLEATRHAIEYPVRQTRMILAGLYDIITGVEKPDPGGPVRIVEEFQKAFDEGFVRGIRLLMLLSVYLGLFNLLPLPALDGGRLVFLGYELVTRRRANQKIETMVHMVGIMLLGIVMILVTLNDFKII